jgi:hypothetical protein
MIQTVIFIVPQPSRPTHATIMGIAIANMTMKRPGARPAGSVGARWFNVSLLLVSTTNGYSIWFGAQCAIVVEF